MWVELWLRPELLVLTSIEIENFQSLRKLSLKLGKLTVVTGATGSGKSAVLRAVRLLAFNARGVAYITRGAKSCQVVIGDQERVLVVAGIQRGVSRGKDAYWITDPAAADPATQVFTKLAGGVPEQIKSALQLSELNFAAQFDWPFLLDASGGEIARVLGKLTNVTLLFDAARECNRRRLEVVGDLKRAEANLANLAETAQRFRGMKARHAAVSEAEEAMSRASQLTVRIGRLQVLTGRLEAAQVALETAVPPEVPDGARLDDLAGKLARARELYAQLGSATAAAEDAYVRSMAAVQAEEAAHERLHEVLAEAGQCPTCGSVIK